MLFISIVIRQYSSYHLIIEQTALLTLDTYQTEIHPYLFIEHFYILTASKCNILHNLQNKMSKNTI